MAPNNTKLKFIVPLTIILVSALLALVFSYASAQSGVCPDYTEEVTTPGGWYPGSGATCVHGEDSNMWETVYNSDLPCGAALQFNATWPSLNDHSIVTVVFPSSQQFPSGTAEIDFYFSPKNALGNPYRNNVEIEIKSFNDAGFQLGRVVVSTDNYPSVETNSSPTAWVPYYHVIVSGVGIDATQNGYLTMEVKSPSRITLGDYFYSSFIVADPLHYRPPMCAVPGIPPTSTPTPTIDPTDTPTSTPSQTPTGTLTPSPTPTNTPDDPTATPTGFPTSIGGTPSPFPTSTPYVPPTGEAEDTPTPISVATFPAITLPGITIPLVANIPTPGSFSGLLTPNATLESRATSVAEIQGTADAITGRWDGARATSVASFNISNTDTISTPIEQAEAFAVAVYTPFRYAKAVQTFLPNLWPLVLTVLISAGWVVFNLVVKYGSGILSTLLELLRRLIELIPGM